VKATIVDVKMRVYKDIVRHLDKLENESRPSAVMGKKFQGNFKKIVLCDLEKISLYFCC
jgi:hypothetical protein